ncbi:hypothetical protein AF336_05925 [Bradyrhizobium diazoefficiens]|nr:hypothetical protein AF336_05925 [Bradyrhizobium diazoefficiens]
MIAASASPVGAAGGVGGGVVLPDDVVPPISMPIDFPVECITKATYMSMDRFPICWDFRRRSVSTQPLRALPSHSMFCV